jgi:signal transduction histidine kinase
MVEAIDEGVISDRGALRRYAREMRRSTQSLTVLVDDLFELVQLDAGAVQSESEQVLVPLQDIVSDAIGVCSAGAAEAGVSVRATLNGAGGTRWPPQLERVLQNLLQNAIRHTPSGGSVAVDAASSESWVELRVSDTGEGIRADALERIFEPFWRGDAARSTPGSGLGLALVRRLVEALGGTVSVESSPGTGSTFRVRLPAEAIP